jgi:WD40 repeat protein
MTTNPDESATIVFVSYAREDAAFAHRLEQALTGADIRVTGDWQLNRGDSYRDQLRLLILSCDVFLFVLSPDSVMSDACREEVDQAASLGKRMLPVSYRDHGADDQVPASLREPQWTFMRTEPDFAAAIAELNAAVRTDFALAREHQRLSVASDNWQRRGETRADLLRRDSLAQAERWLADAGANPRRLPRPTALVSRFIVVSQANRRWEVRRNFGLVVTLAVVLGSVAAYALFQRAAAVAQSRISASQRLAAQAEGLSETQPDLSFLLAASSWRTDTTVAAHGALISTLQFSPHLARFLDDHAAPVHALAVSDPGHIIASGDAIGHLILHDADTGKRLADLTTDGDVHTLAFSRDGKRIASGGADGHALLWEVSTHLPLWPAPATVGRQVLSVVFSPNDSLLALADIEGTVHTIDAASGSLAGPSFAAHSLGTWAAVFVGQQLLATGGWDGTIAIWDVRTGREVRNRLKGHEAGVRALALSPDGRFLASGALDGTVAIWDWSTAVRVGGPLRGHTGYVETVAFSPDGTLVASSGLDRSIRLWNVKSHALASQPLLGPQQTVWNLRFTPSGTGIVSASEDGNVLLWDLATPNTLAQPLPFAGRGVGDLAMSPNGQLLAAADIGGGVVIWRCAAGACSSPSVLQGHTKGVWRVAIDPRGEVLASAGVDRTVRLWNVTDGSPRGAPLSGPTADVYGLAFSPDGETLAASDNYGRMYFWHWRSGDATGQFVTGHRTGTTTIDFAPHGDVLAIAADTEALLIDAHTHKITNKFAVPGALVKTLAFSPSGDRLAVATSDNLIRLFDVDGSRQWGAPLAGHRSAVSRMSFSRDGRWLVSGDDEMVILWDLQTQRPIGTPLHGHTSTVSGIAFDPVSGHLITGDWDGRVLQWDLSPEWLTQLACGRAARQLSVAEQGQYFDVTSTPINCPSTAATRWGLPAASRMLSKPPVQAPPPDQSTSIAVLGILNQMIRERSVRETSRER